MVAASISTETFTAAPPSDVAPLVLHGRHLNQVSASNVDEFTAAVADSAINKIVLAAGTYELTSNMCTGSAVCISRALTIEAEVPGAVVLNAMGWRQRVFRIQANGSAELIGLNITGGNSGKVHSARPLTFCDILLHAAPLSVELHFALSRLAGRWRNCRIQRSGSL